jgi:hypothetical protein
MSKYVAQFENTFMHSTVESGHQAANRGNEVALIEAKPTALIRVTADGLCFYANVATARSLAEQILRVIDSGADPLWDTEPATGEEVDRWVEDIRAGAIGGNP